MGWERSSPTCRVAWFGVSPVGDLESVREVLERRVAIWVTGQRAVERLSALGVQAQVAPSPAIAFARLAPVEQLQPIADALRGSNTLPPGDFVALDGASDVSDAFELSKVDAPLQRAAAIMVSSQYVGASLTGCALAAAYGRPAVWTGEPDEAPAFAAQLEGGTGASTERVADSGLASLDAALDQLAKLLETAEPEDGRAARALRVRMREEERAAAEREQVLTAYTAQLSNELVSVGPRYTALWRKIHAGDRHYNWHRLRGDRAEADVERLWNMHERRPTTRLKRAIRSTKLGERLHAPSAPDRSCHRRPPAAPKVRTHHGMNLERTLAAAPDPILAHTAWERVTAHPDAREILERPAVAEVAIPVLGFSPAATDFLVRHPDEAGLFATATPRSRANLDAEVRADVERLGAARGSPSLPSARDAADRGARPGRRDARGGRRTRSPTSPTRAGRPPSPRRPARSCSR